MSEPYLGEIRLASFNFAPKGWALCNGQLLALNQNQALFALLGTQFGGDGRVNFALPDFRSRLPLGMGQGTGLSSYTIGQAGGTENVTLSVAQIPQHNHLFNVTTVNATDAAPSGTVLPAVPIASNASLYATVSSPALETQALAVQSCGFAGSNQPHTNIMPYLCLTFIIALQGIFPSQN
jgi:microcystin-dependent protein